MGDASDNIPGIKGVGEKTALKLLGEFKSIENLYENLDNLPNNKMKEKIVGGREEAFLSQKLATIVTDAPVEFELEQLAFSGLDDAALYNALSALEFFSIIKRRGLNAAEEEGRSRSIFSLRNDADIKNLIAEAKKKNGHLAACQSAEALSLRQKKEKNLTWHSPLRCWMKE